MQRERSALDSFPEPIDLNQGSHPNNNSMDRSSSWDNMLNPVENRLSNYMLGPTDVNVSCTNGANEIGPSISNWDRGESSTAANNNMHDGGDSKTNLGWSSFFNCPGSDATSEMWSFEQPSNISTSNRPPSVQNCSSNRAALNLNPNNSLYRSGNSEAEQIPTFYPSSSNVNAFSSSSSASGDNLNNNASGSSFSNWGSSCKRKALEGTSGQFYPPGGSSSTNPPMDKNVISHPIPGCYASRGNLSISSSGPFDLPPTNYSEQLNPSSGVGMSRQSSGFLHSSSNLSESSARNFMSRSHHGRNEIVPFDIPRESSSRNFGIYGAHPSRPISNADSSELRSPMNPNGTLNQSHLTQPYPWSGSFGSRGGGLSSSFMVSGGAREEVSVRTSRRNNTLEYPNVSVTPETRNHVPQDQIDWSFAPGSSLSSRIHSSGTHRVSPGSSSRTTSSSSAAWLPHQMPGASQNQQRLSEIAPWIPFPRVETDSGIQRTYFGHLPSSSSSDEVGPSSGRAQHQLDQRSAAVLMDMPGEDMNGWRALAAVEGRHRLIRQMLTAMRRGVHLQAEEYVLVDPFMSGFAELHDRHRDMRLDVDNMSYEELLALEERIGNVSTGLSEERIGGFMKERKYGSMNALPNLEPCCVCQEDYITGDDIGILNCGHEFHTGCIKQWLTHKNLCPICKMTALEI